VQKDSTTKVQKRPEKELLESVHQEEPLCQEKALPALQTKQRALLREK